MKIERELTELEIIEATPNDIRLRAELLRALEVCRPRAEAFMRQLRSIQALPVAVRA